MFETIRQTKKEQILVFTLIGAIVGFCLGVFYERPGDPIIAQAKQIMAVIALVGSRDGKQLVKLGVEDGQPAKKCHPDPALNPCRANIGPNDDKGEPTLVSTDPKRPLKNVTRSDKIFIFTYEGSHCQASFSGGDLFEDCSPCHGPDC